MAQTLPLCASKDNLLGSDEARERLCRTNGDATRYEKSDDVLLVGFSGKRKLGWRRCVSLH